MDMHFSGAQMNVFLLIVTVMCFRELAASPCVTIDSAVSCKGSPGDTNIDKYVDVLTLDDLDLSQLSRNYFEQFFWLKRLILNDCKVSSLKRSFLPSNSKHLRKLEMHGCNAKEKDIVTIFKASPFSLQHLTLTKNDIKIWTKPLLQGVSEEMQSLNLSSNGINKIQANAFQHLSQLSMIDLSDNKIYRIDPEAFTGMISLRKLLLSKNEITVITMGSLEQLSSLHELNLRSNAINYIADGAFQGAESLKKLDLSYNSIGDIKADTFIGLSSLEMLNLRENQISSIQKDSLSSLKSLFNLDLSRNKIKQLNRGTFNGLHKLHSLNLSENQLGASFRHMYLWKEERRMCVPCNWACKTEHSTADAFACVPGRAMDAIWEWWAQDVGHMETRTLYLFHNPLCLDEGLRVALNVEGSSCGHISECLLAEFRRLFLLEACRPPPIAERSIFSALTDISYETLAWNIVLGIAVVCVFILFFF